MKALIRLQDAQSDLGLHCTHMPEDKFWHGMAQILLDVDWLLITIPDSHSQPITNTASFMALAEAFCF